MNEQRNIPLSEGENPVLRDEAFVNSEQPKSGQVPDLGLGLGLERIGEFAIRRPKRGLVALLILSLIAVFGVSLIKVDDSLTELFRSNTPEFAKYETLTKRFPASEYDVLIVVEHEDLLTRERIELLRELTLELQFNEGNGGLISIFSGREPPGKMDIPPPLIPAKLPKGENFEALKQRILTDQIVGEKMISKDGTLALIVMALKREEVEKKGLGALIKQVRQTVDEMIGDTELRARLSGPPVMQLEIRNAVLADRIIYNGLGFLLGTLVCLVFFRSLSLTLVTIAAPAIAILWSLGALGLMGIELNLFLNVITPLIMVIAYSDAMHMTFAIRRKLARGLGRHEAVKAAIAEVGPACVLTSFTTAVAVSSLMFASSALIATFGFVAAISTLISFLAVIIVVPLLSTLLLRDEQKIAAQATRQPLFGRGLSSLSERVARTVKKHSVGTALAGYFLVLMLGAAYLSLEPRYRLADQVPDREEAISASNSLDEKLTGANPIHIMIELGQNKRLYSRETLGIIAEAQKIMESAKPLGNVWSLEVLRRWLVDKGKIDTETLRKYVKELPRTLTARFIAADEKTALVTGRMADLDAASLLPVVHNIDRQLRLLRVAHPDYQLSVTGLPAISARNSHQMIGELAFGLMSTIAIVVALIALQHPIANRWALSYARKEANDENALLILLGLIDAYERGGNPRGQTQRLDNAVNASQILFERSPDMAANLLRPILSNPKTNALLRQGILLGLIRSQTSGADAIMEGLPAFDHPDTQALRLLLILRGQPILTDSQQRDLELVVRGGGSIEDSLRAQAAWAYLKRAGHNDEVIHAIFRP
ncbi:MAG: MMPL family transporter [Hyphomicrobiaceae bacterium]|nr:MMPL family transporter [Hyphomicrobiaceae bacterium]